MAKSKDSMKGYAKKRQAETAPIAASAPAKKKSVEIKQAENGYIVSQYIPGNGMNPGRDRQIVCSSLKEAQAKAASLLSM